jgi:2-keto-4-pentenoate hydratase
MKIIETLAQCFFDVFYTGKFAGDPSFNISEVSLDQAYRVQDSVTQKRIDRGEAVVGYKVGCTSFAIQSQLGLKEPICGKLFASYLYDEEADLYWNEYVNCAIEPEMVLKIGKDLKGYNLSDQILIDAIEYVSPGLEIHNCKFWYTPVTSQELICANGIHAGLVVGNARVLPEDLSFKTEIFEVLKKGRLIATAPASEIMGGPFNSLRWLIGFLTKKGRSLEPDTFVIPGSPVELITINEDTELTIKIGEIGSITKNFGKRLFGDH